MTCSPVSGSRWPALLARCLALCAALTACGATCDRNPDRAPTPYAEGTTAQAGSFYMSASPEGPFLDFPAGETYRFMHGLNGPPVVYDIELAFSPQPLADPGGGLSKAAGNQAVVEAVTDEYIQVRNDTCSDFFIRLTAQTLPLTPPAPSPDGG